MQGLFLFRFPLGMLWDEPFIPSIMVPYGLTSDFYFSGHCGFMVLVLMETLTHERHMLKVVLMVLFLAYVMFILVLFRVHYSIGSL